MTAAPQTPPGSRGRERDPVARVLGSRSAPYRALDLYCCAGGASMGLHQAGFDVVGIDIEAQPQYPFPFIQADVTRIDFARFDFVWASPPCQAYCAIQNINTRAPKRDHPRLIEPVRRKLVLSGAAYCIENVIGAPLIEPVVLCGSSFGLGVRRHRQFECNFPVERPDCRHAESERPIAVYGDHPQGSKDKSYRINRARTLAEGQAAMGIDWMDWRPLTQAIPPAFAEHIGRAAIQHLNREAA